MNILFYIPFITLLSFFEEPTYTYTSISEDVIIIEGNYFNENIYLENQICNSGVGYCVNAVRVNGALVTDNINSNAFEIDFDNFDLKKGEKVYIEVKHKKGCSLKVLNPKVLLNKPTFELIDIAISDLGLLNWSTVNESGSLPFIIQQYRWNKWHNIGEVDGIGLLEKCNYSFKVDFNSGVNKFRVIQEDKNGKAILSKSILYTSSIPKLNYLYNRQKKQLVFSSKTKYEIHDKYGVLIKRGYNDIVDLNNIPKDHYWLSYDNVTENFKRN